MDNVHDITSKDVQLVSSLRQRVEAPSFGTVFFAGLTAGQLGFLTRGFTRKAGKYVLGQISDKLVQQARSADRLLPGLQRELIPSVLSPVQQLTYYAVSKTKEPQAEQQWQWYVPTQLVGQTAQLIQPRYQARLAQKVLTPEQLERLYLGPKQFIAGLKQFGQTTAESISEFKTKNYYEAYQKFAQGFRQLFTRQFWAGQYESVKEQTLQKFQQPLLGLQEYARFRIRYGYVANAPAVQKAVYEEIQRRLARAGESLAAKYKNLEPVTVRDIIRSQADIAGSKSMNQLAALVLSRIRAEPGEVESWISKLAGMQKYANLPVGFGIYKKPGAVVKSLSDIYIIPSSKLIAQEQIIGVSKSLQIPYLSFNPLRLFVPPTFGSRLFGEFITPIYEGSFVPTLYGQMGQNEAQLWQQLQELRTKKTVPQDIRQMQEQFTSLVRDVKNISKESHQKIMDLKTRLVERLTESHLMPQATTFVVGNEPMQLFRMPGEQAYTQKRIWHMLRGYTVPVQEVGSGIYRQYFMQLGKTIDKQASDIIFSQAYNLQPNLFQQIYSMAETAFAGDKSYRRLKDTLEHIKNIPEQFAQIGEVLQKLKESGYFREVYKSIDISKITDADVLELVNETFYKATGRSAQAKSAVQSLLHKLEPAEESVIQEITQQFSRNVITEEWLSSTVKAGGRTRQEILQELFATAFLVYPEDVLANLGYSKKLGISAGTISKIKQDLYSKIKDQQIINLFREAEQQTYYASTNDARQLGRWVNSIENQLFGGQLGQDITQLARSRLSGLGTILKQAEESSARITNAQNTVLYFPDTLSVEQLEQIGIKGGFLEQFLPGILKKLHYTSEIRSIITEPQVTALHFAYRPVELLETLGAGGLDYTKIHNALDAITRVFTRKIFPVLAGFAALGTIDQLTGLGSAGQSLLSNLYVGGISLLNATGIGPLGRYVHTHAPSLLPTAGQQAGLYLFKDVGQQFVLGQFGQLIERTPTSKEQAIQQEGIGTVEKRKSAGWEFGRGPYWGMKTQYYRQFLPYLNERDWQFSENVYGSRLEYMAFQFPFPNPLNLFGLTWLIDPYHYEKKLWYYRPYPVTGPMPFTEIPLLGPLLTPLSYLIKPTIQMQASAQQLVQQQQGTSGFSYMQLQREYLQSYNTSQFEVTESTFSGIPLTKQLQDYFGIIGFQSTQITGEQFAGEAEYYQPKLQHSGTWGSVERMYYMAKLGNIFGLSEFIRRMIPHDEAGYPQFNPLINPYLSQFEWLPERYKTGDQYQSMDFGEVRLPGPQYEKTHYLIDNYGPIDQFLILQNVQPYSEQYEQAKQQVLSMLEQNPQQFTDYTRFLIQQQIQNAEKVRQGLDVHEKVYTKQMQTEEVQLKEYLGNGMFTVEGQSYLVRINGIIANEDELQYQIYKTKDVTFEEQYNQAQQIAQQINQQLQDMAGKRAKLKVLKDKAARYTYTEDQQLILEAGLPNLKVPAAARKYDTQEQYQTNGFNFLRQFWDVQSNFVPETFMFEKFFQYREPQEQYARYSQLGKWRMLWHRVISDIIVPNFSILTAQNPLAQLLGGLTTGSMQQSDTAVRYALQMATGTSYLAQSLLPQTPRRETKERWEFEKQMDYLQMLQDNMRGARPKSVLGMHSFKGYGTLLQNAPLDYKQYIPYIVNLSSSETEQILDLIPDYLRENIEQVWRAKQKAIERQEQGKSLDFRTAVEHEIGDVDVNEYLEELGDYLKYIDLRTYKQMLQLDKFQDVTQMSVTPQAVYQQLISTVDQKYLTRSAYSTAQFNSEYLRQMYESQRYTGQQRVVLSQNRRDSTYNYFVM